MSYFYLFNSRHLNLYRVPRKALSAFSKISCTSSYVQFLHVQVVEWFAERADRILLLFDAHKLDISDEV